ncbi:MAG: hypothetical protein AAF404_21500, partial [Pseudomonadota bacterium]
SLIDLYTIEDFQFDFSPATPDSSVHGASLHSVAINVHGYLLHDGVLISLLQQLAQHAPGSWYFESIEIQRHTGTDVKLPAADASDASYSLEFNLVLTWVMVVLPDNQSNVT